MTRVVRLPGPAATTATQLLELEPALKPGPGRRLVLPRRRPPAARQAHERLAPTSSKRRGDDPRALRASTGFVAANGRAAAADTAQGELPADVFVVATGAWTPLLNEQLGCRIPIQPGKGY